MGINKLCLGCHGAVDSEEVTVAANPCFEIDEERILIWALTEREKQILRRLKKGNMSDYVIARKLKVDTANVTHSRLTALRKIERAQADLDFALQVE